MGALTLKTFPFELRGWELEKFNYIDLTDSFGSHIKVSINNKKIIQIEPGYNNSTNINWLNDKGRQFFDSLIMNSSFKENSSLNFYLANLIKSLYKTIYLFEFCNLKNNIFINSFIIIYENLSNNLLYLLLILTKKYSFITLKKSEIRKINNNLQIDFLLNKTLEPSFLKYSSFCLLMSNIRFESSILNLTIKQRVLKGNFKCFLAGSFLNLTYNTNYLGTTNIYFLKTLVEGNHFICQNLKNSEYPIIILNSELFKRNDFINFQKMLNSLNFLLNKIKLNFFNLSIFETGNLYFKKPEILTNKDLLNASSLYFINLTDYSNYTINKLINLNLFYKSKNKFIIKKTCINQTDNNNNLKIINTLTKTDYQYYLYMPVKTFFETKSSFINTQGFLKNTLNLNLTDSNTKSNWKIIRNILNNLNRKIKFINVKNQFKIEVKLKNQNINIFSKFILKTTHKLSKTDNITTVDNLNLFFLSNAINHILKNRKIKMFKSFFKNWLNDFFSKGKDNFSKNSLVMIRCSKLQKLEKTNFF